MVIQAIEAASEVQVEVAIVLDIGLMMDKTDLHTIIYAGNGIMETALLE